jgi:UDP-glucose 4-epimerase
MAHNSKKILVTGASGLIGRQVFSQLQQQYSHVIGVDNNSRFDHTPKGNFVKAELAQYLASTVNDYDYIYHMAAINGTEHFYKTPSKVLENNTLCDLNVFNFAKSNSNTKLIYASTSEIVAGTDVIPTPEETDVLITDIHNPRWSYRIPKILGENFLVNSNINYVIVRFFNVFSEHCGSGHFLRDQINKIRNNVFEIVGPNETRSFCYVEDAVAALIDVAEKANKDIVNIGSQEEITVKDACDVLAAALGVSPQWTYLDGLQGSVSRRCPDISKLKSYSPTFAPMTFEQTINKIKDKL